jgi:hypothetical protein
MLGSEDKRNFFRMMLNSPCELTITDSESSRTIPAICKDISATGMSFDVEEPSIELGTVVEVSIESNSNQIPSLQAKVRVVRCNAVDDTDLGSNIGVEVLEMK